MRVAVNYQGRVQGVGFRATARHVMLGQPVSGWVRNEPDGSVQMEVQGEERVVEACLSALRMTMGRNIRQESRQAMADVLHESGFIVRH